MRLFTAAVLLAAVGITAWSAPNPVSAAWVEDGTDVGKVQFSTGRSIFIVPDGLRNVDVEVVGGKGSGKGTIPGGQPAQVNGRIAVPPGGNLHVMVGGDGSGVEGGFNGGGDAMSSIFGAAVGGGGGGATDIRTIAPGGEGSLESRLIVAAGGGGAGSTANGGGKTGGAGGAAGVAGGRAESAGPGNTVGSGGFGGGVGGVTLGGAGGDAGYPYGGSGSGQTGTGGSSALGPDGGNGGRGPDNTPAGWGGGGGGGLYGGGGGGGGGMMTGGTPTATGGGGGGGGSLLVPPGGTGVVESINSTPSAEVSYTIPGTEITSGPADAIGTTSALFQMASTEADSILECQMDFGEYEVCASPLELSGLDQGAHTLRVRAVNSMDNFDPTPATWSFAVDSIAPITTIDGGPTGKTEIRRPEFRFSSTEFGVSFNCRFDTDQFGTCAEADSEIPGSALSYGPHTFSVRATDPTGNVGPVATRSFEVVEASDPGRPSPPNRPNLKLGRVKLVPKRGIALLPATVSTAGRVALAGSRRSRPHSIRVDGRATVKLKVRAKGPGTKALMRSGRLALAVRVAFVADDGTRVERKKKLTLKLKAGKKRG